MHAKRYITKLGIMHKKDFILNFKIEFINTLKMDTLNIKVDDEEDKKLIIPNNNINKDITAYINNL